MPNNTSWPVVRRTAAKEIDLFFSSPVAYLFLGVFLAVTLFVFFWVEAFFSRNIADIRPMFEWMPVLLIFLCSTLTMRLWSEEKRTGTLEFLLTRPYGLWHFVAGKFLSCLWLLLLALCLTLPLPVTVALLGDLDWGPVWSGYLATFLLGAAYLSIGLFVSARCDNQIVSLIGAMALCSVFYLIGSPALTDFVSAPLSDWLKLLGSGARFEAIARGVIDLRDLVYYLSLTLVFLSLNTLTLEQARWANNGNKRYHRQWRTITALAVLNLLVSNVWIGQIHALRIDTTQGQQYSLSDATHRYLSELQEPLLLRGYFSDKTHPLLAPLVPQLKDLLREYEVAGKGKVRVEFIDPQTDQALEQEANEKYGIAPVPFQVADRYQASIVSSYFNVLVQYGDQYQTLGFRDFIEVMARAEGNIDVALRNPEHDLTSAIKKNLQRYQTSGNVFDAISAPVQFTGYISDDAVLPTQLIEFRARVEQELNNWVEKSDGKLAVSFANPDNDTQLAEQLAEAHGLSPLVADIFAAKPFYFYLTLQGSDQWLTIPLEDLSQEAFARNLKAGLQRFARGFSKTVGLVTPPNQRFGGRQFSRLSQYLGDNLLVKSEDIGDGSVSGDTDILLLAAPENLTDAQVFAVDQFLMQGGTVVMASSPFGASLNNRSLSLSSHNSGLQDWLAHHGVSMPKQLVQDASNATLPIPVTRNLGGFQIQDVHMVDYPYFVDIRPEGLHADHPATAGLPQATLTWASPIEIDAARNDGRAVDTLLRSSAQTWLSDSTRILPDNRGQVALGDSADSQVLGVAISGQFESFFKGKASPLLPDATPDDKDTGSESKADAEPVISQVIERSPASARLIVFSSNDFLSDAALSLASASLGAEYTNPLALVSNTLDWALDDDGLTAIRARGHFNRTLPPMEQSAQILWEYGNYLMAFLLIALVALAQKHQQLRNQRRLERAFTATTQEVAHA
ncbi:Gldg family protein [Simiduia agarivorans]|uniref:ABC transporter permease n=1 Tax=Simiduia agarivorans (strain DSM 21679 / JCM 13881 / BCRC 17597 / SA1) TaxID=1117647 RepID=K4KME6_SIMAS|nr:Gldg family protein [Simiduia agarivorans]AFV00350.1 hypothetical protein M5M_16085 [Simiduia agarivorans SA1 = DSM 21679]